jgi:hypothetical protein
MQKYIGTKTVLAKPMNRGEYSDYRDWMLPPDENPEDEGYLVELTDAPYSNHPNHKGYISWSPKEIFEADFSSANQLTFGQAIEVLKIGGKVAREGWNGKDMFLFLLPAGRIPKTAIHDPMLKKILEDNGQDHFDALGSIRMKTADNKILTGWLASQTDMLAEDWKIV